MLFPEDGITKGELASYYDAIARAMLPHLRKRPVTMERYPAGIGKKGFFQKDVSKGFPEWLSRVEVPKKDGTVRHPLVDDRRSLLWLANQNCIKPHVWPSRAPRLYQPDLCVFDLDPSEEEPHILRGAALGLRDLLDELGLPSWVKTSGSKGFHIVVARGAGLRALCLGGARARRSRAPYIHAAHDAAPHRPGRGPVVRPPQASATPAPRDGAVGARLSRPPLTREHHYDTTGGPQAVKRMLPMA